MNRIHVTIPAAFAVALMLIAAAPTVQGHDESGHGDDTPPAAAPANDASAEVELHDLELVDERGNPVRFVSDALAGRIVVIDFIYTTCTTACPVLSSILSIVQEDLGRRAGSEVGLVSVSIEPVRDTPRRMADYARKFDAGEGWIWLTGEKSRVDRVLTGLGAYSPEIIDHPPMFLVGDAERGVWRRLFGFPAPEDILAQIDELAAARSATKTNVKLGE